MGLSQTFGRAVHGSDEAYRLSLMTTPDIINYARGKFDRLSGQASVEQNQANLSSIHHAIFVLKARQANKAGHLHISDPEYDMWVLDKTWDSDPLNGRSNAQMSHEMFKRAGIKDNAEIYSSRGLSGFEAPKALEVSPPSLQMPDTWYFDPRRG